MALVDPDELQQLLGLAGNTLYPAAAYEKVAAAAERVLLPKLTAEDADGNPIDYAAVDANGVADYPEVREAALAIAVDMWQARKAPGGQAQAADWTPGPYRLGRSILGRVSGLIGDHLDPRGMVG